MRVLWETLYPQGGWSRAFEYVKHRLRRLPGSPEHIARGIWAGVFVTFSPFFGLHFFVSALLAVLMRGNVLAALLATFFGNPLTYVPIAAISLQTGHWILGTRPAEGFEKSLGGKFVDAGRDLWDNFLSIFTPAQADWMRLGVFWDEVFYPWLVGGLVPGVISATVCYYLAVPLIRAYQNRRRGKLAAKIDAMRKKAMTGTNDSRASD